LHGICSEDRFQAKSSNGNGRSGHGPRENKAQMAIQGTLPPTRLWVEIATRQFDAHSFTIQAAENAGCAEATHKRIRDLVSRETLGDNFVGKVLSQELGLT